MIDYVKFVNVKKIVIDKILNLILTNQMDVHKSPHHVMRMIILLDINHDHIMMMIVEIDDVHH
jgi:hypothetical protein